MTYKPHTIAGRKQIAVMTMDVVSEGSSLGTYRSNPVSVKSDILNMLQGGSCGVEDQLSRFIVSAPQCYLMCYRKLRVLVG